MKWGRVLTGLLTIALLTACAWAQTKTVQKSGQKSTPSAVANAPDSTKNDSSPSLAETIDWMKQTLKQYGQAERVCMDSNPDGSACRNPWQEGAELTPTSGDGCSIELHTTERFSSTCIDPGTHLPYTDRDLFRSTARLNLRDLDPDKIEVTVGKAGTRDAAGCSLENRVIKLHLATRNDSKLISLPASGSMVSSVHFYVATEPVAARFAKAMKHAVKLCSEKKSLF